MTGTPNAEAVLGGNAEIDTVIRQRFGAAVKQALEGGLADWTDSSPEEREFLAAGGPTFGQKQA